MNVDFWDAAILDPLRRLAQDALAFLLNNFLAMVVVLVIGFLAAALLRFLVGMTLRLARFDRFCERHGITSALRAAGIERGPSQATARLAYWLVMFVFLMLSLAALNIPAVNDLVSRFFIFLPNVLAAVVILVLGYLAAAFLQRATLLAAVNAGVARARALGTTVQVVALLFTVAIALEQLGIGRNVVLATFTVAFGSIGLAAALAFGYAARDLAQSILERQLQPPSGGDLGGMSHL